MGEPSCNSTMQDLFSKFGTIKKHHVNYDKSGRSLGTAEVTFDARAAATTAQAEYNNVTLDGK